MNLGTGEGGKLVVCPVSAAVPCGADAGRSPMAGERGRDVRLLVAATLFLKRRQRHEDPGQGRGGALAAILIGTALPRSCCHTCACSKALAAARRCGWATAEKKVREAQQKLKNWHYLDGNVDGIFGPQTQKAVMYFQRKNGLTQDGIIGPATAAKMGLQLAGSSQFGQQV